MPMGKLSVDIRELYVDNRVLTFLLSSNTRLYRKVLILAVLFLTLPLSAFVLSVVEGIVFIPGKPVGMLEDHLYITYVLIIVPSLLLLLHNVMRKYRLFLEDIFFFCKPNVELELRELVKENTSAIQRSPITRNIVQYVLGMAAVASNISSIIRRESGWDSLDYPFVFTLVSIHLFFVLGFILPAIIMRFVTLVYFQIRITKKLVERDLLRVKPLSPDGAGGLRSLGKLSLSYTYMLIPFILALGVQYVSWDYLTPGFYLGVFGFLPLSVFVFFFPLSVVHKAMDETKTSIMKKLSQKYDQLNNKLLEKMNDENWENELMSKNKALEIIDNMYKIAEKMPVWPFNTSIMVRFLSFNIFPIIVFIIQLLVNADSIIYNMDKLKIFEILK